MERIIVGLSEVTEAEFGFRDNLFNKGWTIIQLYDNEPVSVEGFDSLEEAKASLVDVPKEKIEIL